MKSKLFIIAFLSFLYSSNGLSQEKYNTSLLVEWGHGGNGVYTQSISLIGHTNMVKDILYLDFGLKTLTSPKHLKDSAISQVLAGTQAKLGNIYKNVPFYLGIRGGYGWMHGDCKDLKGGCVETFARIKLTKHLSCGYYFTYQHLGEIADISLNSKNHEGKIIYQF